jgi:hypothetical protein
MSNLFPISIIFVQKASFQVVSCYRTGSCYIQLPVGPAPSCQLRLSAAALLAEQRHLIHERKLARIKDIGSNHTELSLLLIFTQLSTGDIRQPMRKLRKYGTETMN